MLLAPLVEGINDLPRQANADGGIAAAGERPASGAFLLPNFRLRTSHLFGLPQLNRTQQPRPEAMGGHHFSQWPSRCRIIIGPLPGKFHRSAALRKGLKSLSCSSAGTGRALLCSSSSMVFPSTAIACTRCPQLRNDLASCRAHSSDGQAVKFQPFLGCCSFPVQKIACTDIVRTPILDGVQRSKGQVRLGGHDAAESLSGSRPGLSDESRIPAQRKAQPRSTSTLEAAGPRLQ